MKSLSLLNDDTTIKLGDTGTMVQFTATDNQAPVQLEENQTAQFRIKNDFGLVKTITATTTYNGLIFQFDTADLKGLVQGTYQVELAVNVDKDNTLIFPDDGFVSFTISANALSITGQQLNLISLDDFKEQIKDYVQQETQELKDDFSNYVATVKQGPKGDKGDTGEQGETGPQGVQGPKGDTGEQGIQGPKGDNGVTPTVSVGTVNTVSSSTPASVTNSGSGSNVVLDFNIPQGEQGSQGEQGPAGSDFNLTWTDKGNLPKSNEQNGDSSWLRLLLSNNFIYLHGWINNGKANKGFLTFTIDTGIVHRIGNTGALYTSITSDSDYYSATASNTGGVLKLDLASGQVTINSAASTGGYRIDWLIPLFNINLT